jgi:hypothetical protein
MQLRAAAELAGKFVKRGLEINFAKKGARQFYIVEVATKVLRFYERRAEKLERPCRAATFGNICPFEKTHPRIYGRGFECRHVWGGHHPGQTSFIEPHRAFPVLHRQDRQLAIGKCFASELQRQFANGPAVSHPNGMHTDK